MMTSSLPGPYPRLLPGAFIRVRALAGKNDPLALENRAGRDAMVFRDLGPQVALYFGHDRFDAVQPVVCAGAELWNKADLDWSTLDTEGCPADDQKGGA